MRKSTEIIDATPNDPRMVDAAIRACADLIAAICDEDSGVPIEILSPETVGALLNAHEELSALDGDVFKPHTLADGSLGLPE